MAAGDQNLIANEKNIAREREAMASYTDEQLRAEIAKWPDFAPGIAAEMELKAREAKRRSEPPTIWRRNGWQFMLMVASSVIAAVIVARFF